MDLETVWDVVLPHECILKNSLDRLLPGDLRYIQFTENPKVKHVNMVQFM